MLFLGPLETFNNFGAKDFLTTQTRFMETLRYPITRATLAKIYRVRPSTLTAWLREIEINHKRTLSPKDLRAILTEYGTPEGVQIIV